MELKLSDVIKQVGSEKGVDRKVLVETMEVAIATAAKRIFGQQREIEAYYNEELDEIELFQILKVSEEIEHPFRDISIEEAHENDFDVRVGDELLVQIFYRPEDIYKAREQDRRYGKLLKLESAKMSFGRIAAQTAKQVILQRMREAEQDIIYGQFSGRVGELMTGVVRRFEKKGIIVDVDRTEAILPTREQSPRETYRPHERIVAYVKNVLRSGRDPQIILSRSDPGLVEKLFEQEVPEIYEGIVTIRRVAREAGQRTKVAVYSKDTDVDPVGACVGIKGTRVQKVVEELQKEKIDIVPFSEVPARFVCSAISPAEVSKVLIDEGATSMELIVPDEQLSLAIGKGGQNVRLAAQLTGWNLDIISESQLRTLMQEAKHELMSYGDIAEDLIDTLFTLGYNKLEHIAQVMPQELAQIPGFGMDNAELVVQAAAEIIERNAQARRRPSLAKFEIAELCQALDMSERAVKPLHAAGYRTPELLLLETNVERLGMKTGFGLQKSNTILKSIANFVAKIEGFDYDELAKKRENLEAWLTERQSQDIVSAYEATVGPISLGKLGIALPENFEAIQKEIQAIDEELAALSATKRQGAKLGEKDAQETEDEGEEGEDDDVFENAEDANTEDEA
ncbi:MAG: transcription termination factor NusA [Bradymonadales bacterium]